MRALVRADREWIPNTDDGSLYLRPFMIANGSFLGMRPSTQFIYAVIASSVGAYFRNETPAVSLWVTREYVRAAPGGTGEAKCGGNYAGEPRRPGGGGSRGAATKSSFSTRSSGAGLKSSAA